MESRQNTYLLLNEGGMWAFTLMILFLLFVSGSVSAEGGPSDTGSATSGQEYYGLCFSPFFTGENPETGQVLSVATVEERMKLVAPYTGSIRTYSTDGGMAQAGEIAHRLGLTAAIGIWLGADPDANEKAISAGIAVAKNGQADMMIVGSETVLRGDLSTEELIRNIQKVRAGAGGIPVTTAEPHGIWLDHPELIDAVDQVYVHVYPFWESVDITVAPDFVKERYAEVKAAAGGKSVVISETGWPKAGSQFGRAAPSLENAKLYRDKVTAWAAEASVPYYYFEAFDEEWKDNQEGTVGSHWGVLTTDGHDVFSFSP
ncbi:MAG TPA: glycosyl hydrolase family 17 protein [Methanospirillum sp.]|nr:glycosyl hydrolase family 17 protein [Methanospirillum sp.]